ncbi:Uma2 family endonuclease [Streptacidiphilus sp. MAP12-33]|uniref:Uma2 family endonuclease n=1 Tax=Streptacidiphilus sp. MAP12-33 TaxID=3156266 RepID=UPI003515D45F
MSALPVDDSPLDDVWAALAHVEHDPALAGFRAELLDGVIFLSPPPVPDHERIITRLATEVVRHDAKGEFTFWAGGSGLLTESGSGVRPDLIITDTDAFSGARSEYNPVAGEPIHLVVEVTSTSTRDQDYRRKRQIYAEAGIPYYLIVDRQQRICLLHRLPDDGTRAYDEPVARVPFGQPLSLPAPLSFDVDTAQFG